MSSSTSSTSSSIEGKHINRAGYGEKTASDGDRVWDGTEHVFGSCPVGEDPFTIVLGQEQTIVGLESMLKTMKEGEIAALKIPPELAFGAGGNPHGFHGRGQPIPADATLLMQVQLVYFEPMKEMEELACQSLDAQCEYVAQKKTTANEAFKNGLIAKACVLYRQCVALLQGTAPTPPTEKRAQALLVQLYSNLAACKAKSSTWRQVIELCNSALTIEPDNCKCLFRRGRALLSTGKYEQARSDLRRAAELEPADKDIQAELQRLDGLLKRMQEQEKTFAEHIIQGMRSAKTSLVPDRPPDPEEEFTKCNLCGIKVEKVQLARHVIKAHSETPKHT